MTAQTNDTRSRAGRLIFLCWLMYLISYFGKVNYSATINQVMEFYHVDKPQAGMVPTFFFFAYGIGQVVNGLLSRHYNIKWTVFGALTASAAINLTIAVSANFAIVKWLWMVNGFVLSLLWPLVVRLLAESLPQKDLTRSSIIMSTPVAIGTLGIYAFSALFVAVGSFKLSFYTAAAADFTIAMIWLMVYGTSVRAAKQERGQDQQPVQTEQQAQQQKTPGMDLRMVRAMTWFLCLFAVGGNLIKDGLTTWVPTVLKEEYALADSISILLTLLLPITAIFGAAFAGYLHKKVPDYVTHCFVSFMAMAVFMGVILGGLRWRQAVVLLLAMIVVAYLASSVNNLITSMYPIIMSTHLNAGRTAGILNGCCYLGSTISAYGLGVVAEHYGWDGVFRLLLGVCLLGGVIWGCYCAVCRWYQWNKGTIL